jgi:hypothetical protein
MRKNWRSLIQNAANLDENWIATLVSRKTPFFREKMAKIADNTWVQNYPTWCKTFEKPTSGLQDMNN